ncbi:histidine triad nucleotide-binding protein [Arcobacter sp. FWKO B]|uniref:histidine triad nucleotide-binding protein n=1 Tax=Arcobacter sp. FWKO B TaxID=2593672 RepID=UPI0018A5BEC4|nr:histidine triad nucleotide-binding protein [Arcobacter sp. FWKO B]QOG12643.1 histidine triad nucleotide-binding protein [Arcobacter sp. FWKO B]
MCIFCAIAEGQIPSKKILENDKFLAFYDINPQTKVHALVIPKEHSKDFNDVSPEVMAEMTTFIHEVVTKLGIKESGYRMITNIGVDGGQEVPHLHFHILAGEKLGKLV